MGKWSNDWPLLLYAVHYSCRSSWLPGSASLCFAFHLWAPMQKRKEGHQNCDLSRPSWRCRVSAFPCSSLHYRDRLIHRVQVMWKWGEKVVFFCLLHAGERSIFCQVEVEDFSLSDSAINEEGRNTGRKCLKCVCNAHRFHSFIGPFRPFHSSNPSQLTLVLSSLLW